MSDLNKNLSSCCVAHPRVELPNQKFCRLPPCLGEWGGAELKIKGIKGTRPGQWQFLVIKSEQGRSQRHYREVEQSSFPREHLLAKGWRTVCIEGREFPQWLVRSNDSPGACQERWATGLCPVLLQVLVLPWDESDFFSWIASQM